MWKHSRRPICIGCWQNERSFHEDLASARRILNQAKPDKRRDDLFQLAREGMRWSTVGGMPKPDVVDAYREVGVEAGLTEEEIQSALAEAVAKPFEPAEISERQEAPKPRRGDQLVIRRASDIEPQPVKWLWPNRIAIGKVTIVAGEPGLGKSQLTCAMAAAVTTVVQWPCDEGQALPADVIILSAEDDAADTIRPRLDAAGAAAASVLIVSPCKVRMAVGGGHSICRRICWRLNRRSRRRDALLVIIDPMSSYLGKVDSHKNAELRAVLEPLGEMAARLGVAVLAITHFSKSGSGSANNRFIGSIAFVAAARAAYIVVRDPEDGDRRLFLPTKNNVGPEGSGLAFRVGLKGIGGDIFAPMILWEGAVTTTAEEALATKNGKSGSAPERENAEAFLRTILADRPLPSSSDQDRGERSRSGLGDGSTRQGVAWHQVEQDGAGRRMGVGVPDCLTKMLTRVPRCSCSCR